MSDSKDAPKVKIKFAISTPPKREKTEMEKSRMINWEKLERDNNNSWKKQLETKR